LRLLILLVVFSVGGIVCGLLLSSACKTTENQKAPSSPTSEQRRLKDEVSVLIDGLMSEKIEERILCCKRLRSLTGLCFDYNPTASEEVRAEGVRRWRIWWSKAKERPTDMWLPDALVDADYRYRAEVAYRIGRRGIRSGVGALLSVLDDADATVREAAASALGMLKETSAVDELGELATTDTSASVRVAAVNSLCAIGEDGWRKLVSVSERLEDTPALFAAVDALALLKSEQSKKNLEAILRRLLLSGDRLSVQFAIKRVGTLRIRGLRDELVRLKGGTDEATRRLIETALQRLTGGP